MAGRYYKKHMVIIDGTSYCQEGWQSAVCDTVDMEASWTAPEGFVLVSAGITSTGDCDIQLLDQDGGTMIIHIKAGTPYVLSDVSVVGMCTENTPDGGNLKIAIALEKRVQKCLD